jgi:4-hydroxyphenylpyruvate dioxygenase-like putative hemolysin
VKELAEQATAQGYGGGNYSALFETFKEPGTAAPPNRKS